MPPQNSGHHLITFFEGHLSFQIHHYGLMWIICLHNISRTTSWNIFLLCGCFFGSFLGLNYIYQWSSQFSKLTTWGQCELFVCTISQEPLDEIFSYLVVASSEVSWDSIRFFGGHLSFQSSPLGGNVNYLSAQYLKNHLMNYFPTLWLLLRNFFGVQLHFLVVILVFKAHHKGAMWIICLHNISRTTSWNIFLFICCSFESLLGFD